MRGILRERPEFGDVYVTCVHPLAQGCEELEAVTVIDLLRRAEIEVVLDQEFDMIVLPGGLPRAQRLDRDERIRYLFKCYQGEGRYTAAVCADPVVLAGAGLLAGKSATSYPGAIMGEDFPQVKLLGAPVVVDGEVTTSRGPGSAMDFALQLIAILVGKTKRDEVADALVRAA